MRILNSSQAPKTLARRCLTIFSIALIAVPLIVTPQYASAQQKPTLFDWLFGPKKPAPRATQDRRRQQPAAKPRPRNRSTAEPSAKRNTPTPTIVRKRTAAPAPVAKLDNAKVILVAGDFLAKSLGDTLDARFQTSATIRIETKANGSSGIVRTDYYDWQTRLPHFMEETKPTITVVMMGANDRQPMALASGEVKFGTPEWFSNYEQRLDSIATIAKQNGSRLVWVGLPAFQSSNFTADALVLNRIYRSTAEKAGGEFIDIWDGFTDEAGKFITTGFDVNGQQARLREADGIALTAAGREKLAFYVERAIRRYIDDTIPSDIQLDGSNLPALNSLPELGVSAQEIRTQPISVTDPDLDGGEILLGEKPREIEIVETPRVKLVQRGEMDEAPLGRIDDYRRIDQEPNLAAIP